MKTMSEIKWNPNR